MALIQVHCRQNEGLVSSMTTERHAKYADMAVRMQKLIVVLATYTFHLFVFIFNTALYMCTMTSMLPPHDVIIAVSNISHLISVPLPWRSSGHYR